MISPAISPLNLIGLVQTVGTKIGLEIPQPAIHFNEPTQSAWTKVAESPEHRVHIEAEARGNDVIVLTLQFDGAKAAAARRFQIVLHPEDGDQEGFSCYSVMKEKRPHRIYALYHPGQSDPCFLQFSRDGVPVEGIDDDSGALVFERGDEGGANPWMTEAGLVFYGLARAVSDSSGVVDLLDTAAALKLEIPAPFPARCLLDFGLDSFVNYPSTDRAFNPAYQDVVHWILEACRSGSQDFSRARERASRLLKAVVSLTEFGKRKDSIHKLLASEEGHRPESPDLQDTILRFFGTVYQAGHILRKLATSPEAREILWK